MIRLAIQKAGVPVYEYTPLQVKQAVTGYGQALKPPGDGDDPAAAVLAANPEAGRRERMPRHGDLPWAGSGLAPAAIDAALRRRS